MKRHDSGLILSEGDFGNFYTEDETKFYFRVRTFVNIKTGELLTDAAGQPVRKQQRELLATKSDKYTSEMSPEVAKLAAKVRKRILGYEEAVLNGQTVVSETPAPRTPTNNITVAKFFDTIFMPDMKALQASGKRAAVTVDDYERNWNQYLKAHFNGTQTFANYTTAKARTWLTSLRKKDGTSYSEAKIRKIKSVASAIFDHGISLDYLNANEPPRINPWDAIKMKNVPAIKTKPEDNKAYTEAEVIRMIQNLDEELFQVKHGGFKPGCEAREVNLRNARILLALCAYAGLRDEEAIALQWQNVNLRKGTLKVCETVVDGVHRASTKTGNNRVIEYLAPLTSILNEWHKEQGSPASGLVVSKKGEYVSPKHLASEIVKPNCEKHGIEWAGWYAARRFAGTHLYLINVPVAKAAKWMGHSVSTYMTHYVKDNGEGTADVARIDRENRAAKAQAAEEQELAALVGEVQEVGQ